MRGGGRSDPARVARLRSRWPLAINEVSFRVYGETKPLDLDGCHATLAEARLNITSRDPEASMDLNVSPHNTLSLHRQNSSPSRLECVPN